MQAASTDNAMAVASSANLDTLNEEEEEGEGDEERKPVPVTAASAAKANGALRLDLGENSIFASSRAPEGGQPQDAVEAEQQPSPWQGLNAADMSLATLELLADWIMLGPQGSRLVAFRPQLL